MDLDKIGKTIKWVRLYRGLSLDGVSAICGLSKCWLRLVERGSRPSKKAVYKICLALRILPSQLQTLADNPHTLTSRGNAFFTIAWILKEGGEK